MLLPAAFYHLPLVLILLSFTTSLLLDFTKIAKKCGFTKLIARIIFKANVTSWLFPMPVDMI